MNIWLCCLLLGGVVAAGGTHYARIWLSLDDAQFSVMIAVFAGGLLLLAALAVVPRRRVSPAINPVWPCARASSPCSSPPSPPHPPRRSCSTRPGPASGSSNGGRSVMLNGHSPNESNAVDFLRLGANGRTHTGGSDAPLSSYAGFGWPVLAPADGRIVEVTDGYADNPAGHQQRPRQPPRASTSATAATSPWPTSSRAASPSRWVTTCGEGQPIRRGREQRPLQRTAPAPAGPGLPGGCRRGPTYPIVFRNVADQQGRLLAVGRQQRGPHRRPRLRVDPPARPATCTRSTARPRTCSAKDPAHRRWSSSAAWVATTHLVRPPCCPRA